MPESEQAETGGEKPQKQEYEKYDHLQGDGTQNPYSGKILERPEMEKRKWNI